MSRAGPARSSKDELTSSFIRLFKREENSPVSSSQISPRVPLAEVGSHIQGLTVWSQGKGTGFGSRESGGRVSPGMCELDGVVMPEFPHLGNGDDHKSLAG